MPSLPSRLPRHFGKFVVHDDADLVETDGSSAAADLLMKAGRASAARMPSDVMAVIFNQLKRASGATRDSPAILSKDRRKNGWTSGD